MNESQVAHQRSISNGRNHFSVQIMLPEAEERRLRAWVAHTPGATWPSWGGHITVLNRFIPMCSVEAVTQELADVCRAFSPFALRLSKVERSDHWQHPELQTVLLVPEDRTDSGYRSLARLRDALYAALGPLKADLTPKVSLRPYNPHVMLTLGVEHTEAVHLAQLAVDAELLCAFVVEEVHLLEFSEPEDPVASPDVHRRFVFALGGNGSANAEQ